MKSFKKERIKNIKSSNFKKYFIYAVGEIIIVVIGIFIALYFNKLNEVKVNKKYIKGVLKNVQSEAESYTRNAAFFIDFNAKRDSLAYKILNNTVQLSDYNIEKNNNFDEIQGLIEISFDPIHVNNLSNRIDYLNKTETAIYNQLLYFKQHQKGFQIITKNAIEIVNDYSKIRKSKNEWYYKINSDSLAKLKEFNFRKNSFEFKNFISDLRKYEILSKTRYYSTYQLLSFKLLFKLKKAAIGKKLSSMQFDSIFQKNALKRFKTLKCDTIFPINKNDKHLVFDNVELYIFLLNASKDTITIQNDKLLKPIKLAPTELYVNEFTNGSELTVYAKDTCKAKYKTQLNGYLYYDLE